MPRKPPSEKHQNITVSLPPDQITFLMTFGRGAMSPWIAGLIRTSPEFRQWQERQA